MRLTGARNAVAKRPVGYLLGGALLALVYWGMFALTRRGVRFLDTFPLLRLGNEDIAEAILQRSLESLFVVLSFGVLFSVLTTAVHTLYSSEDLPFLLSLPLPPSQVFALKVAETYVSAALLPALFTLPVLLALGLERQAALGYYPLAVAAILALYALPVALGSVLALILMRIAPVGRVKEVATVVSVLVAAGFIFLLRALRPEQLAEMTLEELARFLEVFAEFEVGWLPTSWTSQAVWGGLSGRMTPGAYLLAALSLVVLAAVAQLAAYAYREGWIRALDATRVRLDPTARPAAWWERLLYHLGPPGAIISKDTRLLLRDPTQWSQLLVLLALAGVYLVSVGSFEIEVLNNQRFRDAIGTMNLLFMGFLLAGVGIRMSYPVVSLEGEGFWLLKTGPVSSASIVLSKFWHTLPTILLLGAGIGIAAARLIDLSPTLAWASPLAGGCAALATTGLGVGLGAAFPKFQATSPSDIPMSAGGLLYITLALAYTALMTLILAWPAWQALQNPARLVWQTPDGLRVLAILAGVTLLVTALPLAFGSYRLARYEPGD
jgi:ABC-2 type transport system permease protein